MGKRPHLHYIIFMWRLLLITSTKLAGNGIGKFRLPVENSKNRILHILKARLDLEYLYSSIQQIDPQKERQTAKPRIKHPWWSELFTFEIFLERELTES